MERYKSIENAFINKVKIGNRDILIEKTKIKFISEGIPNFILNNLDPLTDKMSAFYNDVQFPNYDDCDDYASLYDKGTSNVFTRRLDEELGYGTNILELGCGTGQLSLFLSRSNRNIFAVDISNGSLMLGEKFRKKHNIKNTYFMKMDVFDLKFKHNTFDCVVSNGVLHHTKDAEEAFKCLVKVTKPGGILVIGLYHKYGRFFTRLKQKLARLLGDKIFLFDKTSRRIQSKDKRKAWVKDQFMNPHETLHIPNEIFKWFDNNNVEFINLIPHYDIQKDMLLTKNEKPKISFLDDLMMAFNYRQIQEGGFFVMVGRKSK